MPYQLLGPAEITGSLSLSSTLDVATSATVAGNPVLTSANTNIFVTSVNGVLPTSGNVAVALTAVRTGDSASLSVSSSGAFTGSIGDGTLWVISGDAVPANNGEAYIFLSGSISGSWLEISPLDVPAADARYIRQNADGAITGSFTVSGSGIAINLLGNTKITQILDTLNTPSINPNTRLLKSAAGTDILDYENAILKATVTGSVLGNASTSTSASYATTSSYALFAQSSAGSSPGGTTNSIQYNNGAGGFGGVTGFSYNPFTNSLIHGTSVTATGNYSYVQGNLSTASGIFSHAEGLNTKALGNYAHSEGNVTKAAGNYSHAEGAGTTTSGSWSHAEGSNTISRGIFSHVEGQNTLSLGSYSHAEGYYVSASGYASHAEGAYTVAFGQYSHAEGANTISLGNSSHAEGTNTTSSGISSHAEGNGSIAIGNYSHAEGYYTSASGDYSHAEGETTKALGYGSHAEGLNTVASQQGSHAEGEWTAASGYYSHAEGYYASSSGDYSHAEGEYTTSNGYTAHAEGTNTIANGVSSHAEGLNTIANGNYSHAEGNNTISSGSYQHVQGHYNTQGDSTSLMIVGNGTNVLRKDAFKVRMSGSIILPTTQSATPTWTGVDGEMIFATVSSNHLFYVWMSGAWRSGSLV
jgi:hypothetical protein